MDNYRLLSPFLGIIRQSFNLFLLISEILERLFGGGTSRCLQDVTIIIIIIIIIQGKDMNSQLRCAYAYYKKISI